MDRLKLFLISIALFLVGTREHVYADASIDVAEALKLLEDGTMTMRTMGLNDNNTEIILLLGNIGSEKATLTSYVAGKLEDLKSLESSENSGEFSIHDNKIERSGVTALFPELYLDENGVKWYNIPSFSESRNITTEVATTFFTKQLIESAQSVKLVFVIDHASLQTTDTVKLAQEASTLLKHIDHYTLSISLVATKVKEFTELNGQREATPDDVIISSIGNYLQNLVAELRTTKDRDSSTEKCVEFLETLLQSSDGVYTRIGIFRRPEKAGLLSEMPSMVQGRASIRKVVLENTEFAKIRSDDFGHTLPDSYRGQVVDLAQQISQNISGTVRKLGNVIENHFKSMSSNTEDFDELLHEFSRAEHVLSQLKTNTNLNVKELLLLITEIGSELEIPFDSDDLKNIMNQQKYLEFLEIVSVEKLPVSSNDWITQLNPCLTYVAEGKMWFLFITEMYEDLSSYSVQSDVTRYNVVNVSEWGETDKPQGIKVDHDNFDIFLQKQNNYAAVQGLMASPYRLNTVNLVLRSTLNDKVTHKCEFCTSGDSNNCALTVQGHFVKTSDINLNYCKSKIRVLNVFALDTIFVDKDITLEGINLEATFIAPKWNITGEREIAFHGSTGPDTPGKGESGTPIKPDGIPGKPGLPGYNGGRVLAVYQKFESDVRFTISADGGTGGKGQEGGDAVVSRDGCGGKGAGGGAGGLPGNPGLIKAISMDQYAVADIYDVPWKKGHGVAGINGKRVDHTRKDKWECASNSWQELKNFKDQVKPKPQSVKVSVSGYIAYKHFVRENLVNSLKKTELLQFMDRMENNAEIQLQYEIKDFIDDAESMESQFLKLHSDVDFEPFYQLHEVKILNFTELPENKDLPDSHKVVFNYLYSAAYSKLYSLRVDDESNLVINILEYLNLIKERINQVNLIGKEQVINKYKNDYKKEIDVKITEANKLIKTEITPEFDIIYSKIDTKIEALVEETIQMQKDKETEIEKYKQQQKELQRNIGLRAMLGSFKAIGQVVGFLGPYGAAAGSAITLGASIGERFVKDPDFEPQPFKMPDGISSALSDIGGVLEYRKEQKSKAINSEIARLEEELKKEDPEVRRTLAETLTDLTKVKDDIKKEKAAANPDQSKIDELEAKLSKVVKDRQEQLQEKSEKPNKVIERSLKLITGVKNALEVAETGIEIYNKFKEDREKIQEVGDLISQSENDLQSLVSYENKIYDTFMPMMRGMRDDMRNVEKNLESKSHVSLDVTKWKVQSHLKELKSKMDSFTKGYSVQEELGECIEKLTFALTTIINIFDRIQSYQDQQTLAVYIANINSPYIQNIKVNGEYRESITKLELMIQSNIIMQLFNNVVSSFKQHVFPFALQYLDNYKVPDALKLTDDNDVNVLKTHTITQIDDMRTKMLKNLTSIQEIDSITLNGEFDYEGHYLKPFYVWEYKQHSEVIDDLLSGNEVFLRANIKAGVNFNAIKFRTININFKTTDTALNVQLQEDLKKFGLIMTHMGDSYYKCDSNFYIISTATLPIEFSIVKGSSSSTAYEKLKSGNILLSPYASWKIKLNAGLQANITKLEVYKEKVDLELVGMGQYVKNNVDVCNVHSLERFYKLDKSIIHEPDQIDASVLYVASPPSSNGYLNLDQINYLF